MAYFMKSLSLICILSYSLSEALKFNSSSTEIPYLSVNTQPGLPGGKNLLDLSKKDNLFKTKQLAKNGLADLMAADHNSTDMFALIRIKEAVNQVVAGISHEVVFYIGQCSENVVFDLDNETIGFLFNNISQTNDTNDSNSSLPNVKLPNLVHKLCNSSIENCTKNGKEINSSKNLPEENCPIDVNGVFGVCWLRILDQPWRRILKVTNYVCKPVPKSVAYGTFV